MRLPKTRPRSMRVREKMSVSFRTKGKGSTREVYPFAAMIVRFLEDFERFTKEQHHWSYAAHLDRRKGWVTKPEGLSDVEIRQTLTPDTMINHWGRLPKPKTRLPPKLIDELRRMIKHG